MGSRDAERDLYRGYDIRGLAGPDLTPEIATEIGTSFAGYVASQSASTVYVGFDGRPSGDGLAEAVVGGLVAGGVQVIELGVVPTPLVYFASSQDAGSFGVAVTASHLAAEWNGLKFCRGSLPIHTDRVRELIERGRVARRSGGSRRPGREAVLEAYVTMLSAVAGIDGDGAAGVQSTGADTARGEGPGDGGRRRSQVPSLRVVLDCQNAAASVVAPLVFRRLGLEVHTIYTDLGAGYPFVTPDPQVSGHLDDLRDAVRRHGATVGFAFDGDADRLGIVDERGRRLAADTILALLAEDVVSRSPGAAVVYDVLSSPVVESVVAAVGGRPVEAPSGHAFVQDAIRREAAPIGGEGSGHIFLADGYRGPALGYDDAIYAAVRLVEYVRRMGPLGERSDALPEVVAGDEWRPYCPDGLKRRIVDEVERAFQDSGYRVTSVDGVKAHFGPLSWALVRAANTEPALSVRVVGPTATDVAQIEDRIAEIVREAAARYDVSL